MRSNAVSTEIQDVRDGLHDWHDFGEVASLYLACAISFAMEHPDFGHRYGTLGVEVLGDIWYAARDSERK